MLLGRRVNQRHTKVLAHERQPLVGRCRHSDRRRAGGEAGVHAAERAAAEREHASFGRDTLEHGAGDAVRAVRVAPVEGVVLAKLARRGGRGGEAEVEAAKRAERMVGEVPRAGACRLEPEGIPVLLPRVLAQLEGPQGAVPEADLLTAGAVKRRRGRAADAPPRGRHV